MQSIDKIPLIIDTDPGDDDAVSILWALSNPRLDVKALTIAHGNVGMEKCTINALRVLELCNRTDIPVYQGAFRPILRAPRDAAWIHGEDGLGDAGFPMPRGKAASGYAPVEMIRIAKASPQPVTILCLAPITNVALAILMDPDFKNHVRQIVFMGGAVLVPGNENPNASFNVAVDPHAAKIVYSSGIPVVQIGLDVCDQVTQRVDDLDEIGKAGTQVTEFIICLLKFRREKAVRVIKDERGNVVKEFKGGEQVAGRGQGIGLNDLTTTAYLINPDWFEAKHIRMEIETHGLTPGRTAADINGLWGRQPNCHFVHKVDGRALVKQWVQDMKLYHP